MTKHGMTDSFEYRTWVGIITRCLNPHSLSYDRYGGRGIFVSEDWKNFENFLSDMGAAPSGKYSVERLDNDKGYCAGNCKWATRGEQALNRSNNRILTHNGRSAPLAQWARDVGLSPDTLERRLNRLLWSTEKALLTPARGWGPGRPKQLAVTAPAVNFG